jgi:hypothetical protein
VTSGSDRQRPYLVRRPNMGHLSGRL